MSGDSLETDINFLKYVMTYTLFNDKTSEKDVEELKELPGE